MAKTKIVWDRFIIRGLNRSRYHYWFASTWFTLTISTVKNDEGKNQA